jgi:hypothetical protein
MWKLEFVNLNLMMKFTKFSIMNLGYLNVNRCSRPPARVLGGRAATLLLSRSGTSSSEKQTPSSTHRRPPTQCVSLSLHPEGLIVVVCFKASRTSYSVLLFIFIFVSLIVVICLLTG